MIDLDQLAPESDILPLGQHARLQVRRVPDSPESSPPTLTLRVFVESNGIRHARPLLDRPNWDGRSTDIGFFPESPGEHRLFVGVSTPGEATHWAETTLQVEPGITPDHQPHLADADPETRLWTPSAWEARGLASHEREMLAGVSALVHPGSVVYDIGANLGLYSTRLGEMAGASGQLYCFEANPLCVYFLRANLARHCAAPFLIFPMAVSDHRGHVGFTINYDNLNLGISGDSAFFSQKAGHRIDVESHTVDDIADEFRLRPPDVIKLDIEGAEAAAVRGMRKTLERSRPVILAELHGREAAAATLALLDGRGYRYSDASRSYASSAEVVEQMPQAPIQVVATPAPGPR